MLFVLAALVAPVFTTSKKSLAIEQKLLSKFVLVLADSREESMRLVTMSIKNLVNQYHVATDKIILVAVEKGIDALQTGNRLQPAIEALLSSDVNIFACESSMKGLQQAKYSRQRLIQGIKTTPDGRKLINNLINEGYVNPAA